MKRRTTNFIFLFVGLAGVFLGVKQSFRQDKIGEDYLRQINLQMSGTVKYIHRSSQHGFGILGIDIIKSNIQFYDERKRSDYYYCVIRNNSAELIQPIAIIETGDLIILNTYERKIRVYRKGNFLFSDPISFSTDKELYRELSPYHKL